MVVAVARRGPGSDHLPVACGQTGRPGAVDALRVSGEVWEETPAPPQQDGQLLVGAPVAVSGSRVRGDGGELHLGQGALGLEGCPLRRVRGLHGEWVIRKGGEGDPDPAQDPEEAETQAGQQPAPTSHLEGEEEPGRQSPHLVPLVRSRLQRRLAGLCFDRNQLFLDV